jgi:hypothetical protein
VLRVHFNDSLNKIFQEHIRLDLKRPTAARSRLLNKAPVHVKIIPSTANVLAGVPIDLTYDVKAHELKGLANKLFYRVVASVSDWIVSGRIAGAVDIASENFSVRVVAIPVRSGSIERYPDLSLFYEDAGARIRVESVSEIQETVFFATSTDIHTAVATPVSKNKR